MCTEAARGAPFHSAPQPNPCIKITEHDVRYGIKLVAETIGYHSCLCTCQPGTERDAMNKASRVTFCEHGHTMFPQADSAHVYDAFNAYNLHFAEA